jgi:hypothetical protein
LHTGFRADLLGWYREEPTPVVCIPPGAQLLIVGISRSLQEQFNLRESEEATFTQTSAEPRWHRDALCFPKRSIFLLGLLPEGQRLRVLRLASREDGEPLVRPEDVLQEV